MKCSAKKILSLLIVAVMLFSAMPLMGANTGFSAKAAASEYISGDTVLFGTYPQSRVTSASDAAVYAALKEFEDSLSWLSYGYYTGTGVTGSMQQSEYMKYSDVIFNGEKYRAVTFSQYRPGNTIYKSNPGNSSQDNNGYTLDSVSWFKYEPVEWTVLDPVGGILLCSTVIDAQAYNNAVYQSGSVTKADGTSINAFWNSAEKNALANSYAESSIRAWLNSEFLSIAFTEQEIGLIGEAGLDNLSSADKVFLLSAGDVQNSAYGYPEATVSDLSRAAVGSDYAKCQGLTVTENNVSWRLSTPADDALKTACVNSLGEVVFSVSASDVALSGIRPAVKLNDIGSYDFTSEEPVSVTQISLNANSINLNIDEAFQLKAELLPQNASISTVVWTSSDPSVAVVDKNGMVTALSHGECTVTATSMQGGFTAECAVSAVCLHSNTVWVTDTAALCLTDGIGHNECESCGAVLSTQAIRAKGHFLVYIEALDPDCEIPGNIAYWHCSECEAYFSDESCTDIIALSGTVLEKDSHDLGEWYEHTAATCTLPGVYARECANCDFVETTETDPTGHVPLHRDAVTATCFIQGYADHFYCSLCNKYFSDEQCTVEMPKNEAVFAKLSHVASDWHILSQRTCSGQGARCKNCTLCGTLLITETLSALNHTENNGDGACDICGAIVGAHTHVDSDRDNMCDGCRCDLMANGARNVSFIVLGGMYYTLNGAQIITDAQTVGCSKELPVTFTVSINSDFGTSPYKVYVNGETLSCNADGVYTIKSGTEEVTISVVKETSGSDSNSRGSTLNWFQSFIAKITAWFRALFGGK